MKYQVELQPSGVTYQSENNLLDDALSQNLILEHSCKTGTCGACRAELIKGEVENESGDIVKSGTVLTCCSKPKSNLVLIANYYPELADIKVQTVPCKVARFEYVTNDILVIRFRFPPAVKFNYLPGQYIDLSFQGIKRSYSIANAKNHDGEIELHIRKAPEGKMSNLLFPGIKENQLMRMEGPKGTFFIRKSNQPLIFIATGTGIAPVKAMVEELIQSCDKREVNIYWGMRCIEELYDTGLEKLANQHSNIQFKPVLSRDETWTGFKGYVQHAVVSDFMNLAEFDVYACGSLTMIEQAKQLFIKHHLPSESFYSDAFTPAK
jgi:CDP-4-dehydro-6-deoxyglucose reductase